MSSEVLVRTATVNSGIQSQTAPVYQDRLDRSAITLPPIEFVTENGFSLVRMSELQPAIRNSVTDCHFLVRSPDGRESVAAVGFDEEVTAQVQTQRQNPLPGSSLFWMTLAEQQLASYIWQNDQLPTGGNLSVSRLSGPELALAAGWLD